MRTLISSAAAATLVSVFLTTPIGATGYSATFGVGPKLPPECVVDGAFDISCTAATSTTLNFSVIASIGAEGLAAFSFGASWDGNLQDALTVDSAQQGSRAYVYASAGPPPLLVTYNPLGGVKALFTEYTEPTTCADAPYPCLLQSTGSAAGLATNFEVSAGQADSSYQILSANGSFRAGRISVTVDDDSQETEVELGFFYPISDSFSKAGGAAANPDFGKAKINAPEPAAGLAALAGIATVLFLGRRNRHSR